MNKEKQNVDVVEQQTQIYEKVFELNGKQNKKSGILRKVFELNIFSYLCITILFLIQHSPVFVMPLIISDLINVLSVANYNEALRKIIIYGCVLIFLTIQNVPVAMFRNKILYKVIRKTSAGIKGALVRKLQHLSISFHKDMEKGKIQAKFLKDTDNVEILLVQIFNSLTTYILIAIVSIIIAVINSGIVSLFFLLVIPVNVFISFNLRKGIRKSNRTYRHEVEDMSAKMTNMLTMLPVTKSHGLEETEMLGIKNNLNKVMNSGLNLDKKVAFFGSSMWAINNLLNVSCVIFSSILAINGLIGYGDVVLYQSLFTSISSSILTITGLIPTIATGSEALRSLSEIMNSKDVEVKLREGKSVKVSGDIKFDKVFYRYSNTEQDTIKNFSLDVKKGECIAVVGASGSGKTTLMNMIIGFLNPTSGEILVDNKPLTSFNLSEYRHNISVVPQNSILFSGSIKENITYGLKKYSKKDLDRVLEMANLNEFINDLPKGIDTPIGECGDKLSGGQKQRITIARALIRNPKILILDEATSALDNISELHVQKAIAESIKGRTTFIVAHRLSTIRDANRIVVMKNGEMVECGTYEELMELKGEFYKLKNLSEIKVEDIELKNIG